MWAVIIYVSGVASGVCGYALVLHIGALFPHPDRLPAATARQLRRKARRARRELSDFSGVRPASDAGVRRVHAQPMPFAGPLPRITPLDEARNFDEEHTHG